MYQTKRSGIFIRCISADDALGGHERSLFRLCSPKSSGAQLGNVPRNLSWVLAHHEVDQMTIVLDLLNNDPRTKMRPDMPRHPEKANRPDTPIQSKPAWIRVKAPGSAEWAETRRIVRENRLVTVCEEASCPNIGECWTKKHATFMIMGDTCTRACAFCNVRTGLPGPLGAEEPAKVADAVAKLGLEHVVVTSVDRDDLADGGAAHFAATIAAIRAVSPGTTIEILTPDFLRKRGALETVVAAKPDVFNHNLETVPSKYLTVRPPKPSRSRRRSGSCCRSGFTLGNSRVFGDGLH
jgi:hypothetical protein